MTRRFEFSEGNANKFWEISHRETDVTVRFGRIGSNGQIKTKSFDSEPAAIKHFNKLVEEKIGKGYVEVVGSSASLPATKSVVVDIGTAWEKIQETIRLLNPDETRVLPEGTSIEAIESVEQIIGIKFSEDFKRSYMLHNGSNRIPVCPNAFLIPISNDPQTPSLLHTWNSMCEVGEDLADEEMDCFPEGPIREVYWHRKWVPIADNECGDYFCLDFAPAKGGKKGQVIDWGHEIGPERVVAPSFGEWLLQLSEDVKAFKEQCQIHEEKEANEKRLSYGQSGWGVPKVTGKQFYFAGPLQIWQDEIARERVRAEGGFISERVEPSLDYVVVAADGKESSAATAETLNLNKNGATIQIVNEIEFSSLFSPTIEELLEAIASHPESDRWQWLRGGLYRPIPLPSCAGLDFRGYNFQNLDLLGIELSNADFRSANLKGSCYFDVCGGNLDGASLQESMPGKLTNASLKNADLSGANFIATTLDGADLSGARMRRTFSACWRAVGALFQNADLSECDFSGCNFQNADFTLANIKQTRLIDANLKDCNLTDACLDGADLTNACLAGANLTRASFQGANLACVDLVGATINGTELRDANLSGAKTAKISFDKAASLPSRVKSYGKLGPAVERFIAIVKEVRGLELYWDVPFRSGKCSLYFQSGSFGVNAEAGTFGVTDRPDGYIQIHVECRTVEDILIQLAHQWNQIVPNYTRFKVKSKGGSISNKELKTLAIAAFREVFSES